jgi:hypothetical protein
MLGRNSTCIGDHPNESMPGAVRRCWTHWYPIDPQSQAMLVQNSTCMGNKWGVGPTPSNSTSHTFHLGFLEGGPTALGWSGPPNPPSQTPSNIMYGVPAYTGSC